MLVFRLYIIEKDAVNAIRSAKNIREFVKKNIQ